MINIPVIGQEAVVPEHGLGRITAICPERNLDGNPKWIQVRPYVANYDMKFDPHNVRTVEIHYSKF